MKKTNDTHTVELTLLTPVHVGTGEKFHPSAGFEYFPEEQQLALLDDEKVLTLLGDDANGISQWVSLIHRRESVLNLLRRRKPDLRAADVARRTLQASAGPGTTTELRPQMHTGPAGEVPYLPGSSLKGAIRAALLATELRGSSGRQHLYQFPENDRIRGGWSADNLTKSVFSPNAPAPGKAPNYDWLRLLHVGDVAFTPGSTECLKAHAFNQRGLDDDATFSDDKPHLLEVLPTGVTGLGTWQLATALRDQDKLRLGGPSRQLAWDWLLPTINAHTRRLLAQELTRLPAEHSPDYRTALTRLLRETDACRPATEAVLRLGFGSGYRFMTGDWLDLLTPGQQTAVARAARRRDGYERFPFPKSRKLLPGDMPLGFVKIRLLTPEAAAERAQAAAAQAAEAAAEQQRQQAEATRVAEAARQPQYFVGKLKAGSEVDAVVEKFAAPMLTLRLYTGGPGQEQTVSLKYPAGLSVGAVCVVKVNAEQKGKVQSVTVLRLKN